VVILISTIRDHGAESDEGIARTRFAAQSAFEGAQASFIRVFVESEEGINDTNPA
jgi:hypothetical protein